MIQDGSWSTTRRNRFSQITALFFGSLLLAAEARVGNNQNYDWTLLTSDNNNDTATTTTTSENTTHNNVTILTNNKNETGQDLARSILQEMQQEDRLTTPFSQRDTAIQLGLSTTTRSQPATWNPCVMKRVLETSSSTTDTTTNILVLGGSTAARPGAGCDTPTDPLAGRYSNILQQQLNNRTDNLEFQVVNQGQGGEISPVGALLMDGRINTSATDLIVWDYSVNDDNHNGGHAEEVRKLDFWLTRLAVQYNSGSSGSTPPPPILLLYLWPMRGGLKLQRRQIVTLDKDPLSYIADLVQRYRGLGWDIAVVNVGGAANSTRLQETTIKYMFDDSLHPGCQGTQFIADLVEHTLWSNLASACTESEDVATYNETATVDTVPADIIPPHDQLWPDNAETRWRELWVDLFDWRSEIGSISPWVPRIEGQSNLNYTLEFNESSWPLELVPMHIQFDREDRKYGYTLPRCNNKEQEMVIVLQEPNLKWIGLALMSAPANAIRLQINNQTVALQDFEVLDDWANGGNWISHWIQLPLPPPETEDMSYTLSFCHQSPLSDFELRQQDPKLLLPNLQYLVGVIVPPSY